ncbi:hypothetical protein HanIR_Chr04g0203471 [Helianthus annuus]|nr:hypothetical protein HanIR_Chr04g0203471 [Helianthus annuus]
MPRGVEIPRRRQPLALEQLSSCFKKKKFAFKKKYLLSKKENTICFLHHALV